MHFFLSYTFPQPDHAPLVLVLTALSTLPVCDAFQGTRKWLTAALMVFLSGH
jgi:hypothetical protein